MTKSLRKETMLHSRLRNKFPNSKSEESKQLYNKQRNLCGTLLHKAKRNYFVELYNRIVNINRRFWKTVNPLISEKALLDWLRHNLLIAKLATYGFDQPPPY